MAEIKLWRRRNYRLWFVADTADVVAKSLRTFVVPLLAFSITQSQSIAGVLTSIESTVVLLTMFIGGVLVDRHDRRKMMILLGLLGALLSIITIVYVAGGWISVGGFGVLLVLFALLQGLLGGSNDAILKSLIPTEDFAGAQSVREGREAVVSLFGSAVSSLLYKILQWVPFMASTILYSVEAIAAYVLPASSKQKSCIEEINKSQNSSVTRFMRELIEGFKWTFTKRRFVLIILIGALLNITFALIGTGTQLVLIARNVDPFLIGLVDTAMGVTALAGSLLAGKIIDTIPTGKLLVYTSFVIGLSYCPLLFSQSYPVILVSLSSMGFLLPALNSGLCGFIFGKTPDDMQGRASSVYEISLGLFGSITPAITGFIVEAKHGFLIVVSVSIVIAFIAVAVAAVTSVVTIPKPSEWEKAEL